MTATDVAIERGSGSGRVDESLSEESVLVEPAPKAVGDGRGSTAAAERCESSDFGERDSGKAGSEG
jgi:hypothetical protein